MNIFESAVKSICNILRRYINDSSNFESDCILYCPLLFNETSSSVSSTLAMTLAAESLLSSAFSEQIAQPKSGSRTSCLPRNTFQKSKEAKSK